MPKQTVSRRALRAEALKKAKQKKVITIVVSCAIALAIVGLIAFFYYNQSKQRVFTDGHQSVTLNNNGSFTARLAHETITGTYTENTEGGNTIISFTSDGETANGGIANNMLTFPDEWDDDHGHGSVLWLK